MPYCTNRKVILHCQMRFRQKYCRGSKNSRFFSDSVGLCKAVLMERVVGRMAGKGRTLEYLKLEEIPWVIHGIDLSQGSHGLYMGLN